MSNWLVDKLIPSIMRSEVKKSSVPEGLWHKCPSCEAVLYRPELEKTLDVCPKCNHHMRIGARARIDLFLDAEGRAAIHALLARWQGAEFCVRIHGFLLSIWCGCVQIRGLTE